MDEAARLLAEILADPVSEAARLVYADHLIERGDRRGELIQVQCAAARLADDDPARGALAERATDLLAVHETGWTRALRELASDGYLQQLTFRRGFVERVRIGAATAERLPAIRALAPIREVEVSAHRELGDAGALGRWLVDVEDLAIHASANATAIARAFARWPHRGALRRLELAGGDDAARAVAATPELRGLESLHVLGATGDGFARLGAAAHLASLTHLALPQAQPGPVGLVALARFANVRSLELPHAQIRGAEVAMIAPLLRGSVRLHGNPLGADGARVLAELAELAVLDLEGTELGDAGAAAVIGSEALASLRRLDVSRCRLTDHGFAAALARCELRRLERLVARDDELGYASARALATAPLPALAVLDLSTNPLADEGVIALATSAGLPALRTLRLRATGCGGRALAVLGASELGARLVELDLARNSTGDDDLARLLESGRLDALASLDLDGCALSRRGVQMLVDAPAGKRLRHLVLTGIADGALAPVFAADLPELRTLVANRFDDAAAQLLASSRRLPRLHTIVARAPALTDAGARALANGPLDHVLWLELEAPRSSDQAKLELTRRFGHHVHVTTGPLLHAFSALGRRV